MFSLPKHHLDLDHAHDHVHWIELFYDLVHVVVIFLLGNYLSHHLSVEGFAVFAGLFMLTWFAWGDISYFNSMYVSTDMAHRLIMSVQSVTIMFMAASILTIGEGGWFYFALAYTANQAIMGLLYHRTRQVGDKHSMSYELRRNYIVYTLICLVSSFLPQPFSILGFAAVMLLKQLSYSLPKIGLLRFARFRPRLVHMSERFGLLLLISVGEGFFKPVVGLAEKGIAHAKPDILVNVFIGGISVFVLCWIYFDLIGNAKPKDKAPRTMLFWWWGHLLLMMSGVMCGIALAGEVKVGFMEPFPTKYAWIGCTGLALYILSLMWLQTLIQPRVAHQFATRGVKMFGIVLALLTLCVVPFVPSIVGNLLWGTALFSQIAIPLTRARRELLVDE